MFRDQKLRGHGAATSQMPNQNPNFRGFGSRGERNTMFSRETPFENFHQLDSMWLIDNEQKNFPYILEWYYTSHNHDRVDNNPRETQSRNSDDHDEENPADLWMPSRSFRNTAKYDETWDENLFEDRARSHLEASASVPLFKESVLQHHESNDGHQHSGRGQWWARTRAQGQETSFIEPPNFYHETSRDCYDNYSERSGEGRQLDLGKSRGLSRTFYMDDLDGGNFDLPFVDVYRSRSDRGSGSGSEDLGPENLV